MIRNVIFTYFLIIAVNASDDRKAKLFFHQRTVTKYVYEKSTVSETIPSSCVAVQQSLPPCRHVRQIRIEPYPTEKIRITASPQLLGIRYEPRPIFGSKSDQIEDDTPRPLSWSEYFGLDDVTVTKTSVHLVTAKYYDPNTVVTFNVRGCHPTKLPFNLPLCNNNNVTRTVDSLSKEVHYVP